MSVQALSWVFDFSDTRGAERLVLLSIANHADNRGRNSWPSVRTICREAGLGETRTKQAIKSLAAAGTIRVEPGAGGSRDHRADRRPNRYTILPLLAYGGQTGDGRDGGTVVDKSEEASSTGVTSDACGGQTGDREPSFSEQDRDQRFRPTVDRDAPDPSEQPSVDEVRAMNDRTRAALRKRPAPTVTSE